MDRLEQNLDTAFLAGGGEMGELMRAYDWGKTSLGEPAMWPRSLKTVVRIMLTSSQPIWIGWGPELVYLYNDAYKSIIGGKHPRALGMPTEQVWQEIWGEIEPLLSSAMKGDGKFMESQLLIMERNGYPEETYYTFSYSPIPGDDGQPAGIICANSDETRRVIGERQLMLLRHVAADAADAKTVDDAVACCMNAIRTNSRDLLFTLVFLRQHGEARLRLAGFTGEGSPEWREAIHEIDPMAPPWNAHAVMRSGAPRVMALPPSRSAWPSGGWKGPAQRALLLPISSAGEGGHEGVMLIGLNPYRLLDERYQDFLTLVAQQLSSAIANAQAYDIERRRAEELARLDLAKTQFFSNVSHEFRTPLTLMQGPLADALADEALAPASRSRLEMVERNVMRLTKLVNSLLEFSRIEAGRHESTFQPTNLAGFTQDLASTFRSAMERAGLRFDVRCEALSQPVYVDHDQWERIVLNLLSNALKFTLHGGVTVALGEADGEAVLSVADTGVGVPADELPRLFERFHRVQGSQSRTHEGSGIGLALVQEMVRLHGGKVDVGSTLNQGTTFTVRLPFGSAHLPAERVAIAGKDASAKEVWIQAGAYVQEALRWLPEAQPEQDVARAGGPTDISSQLGERYRSTWGARIVIADDNADMRQYLKSLLQPYYDVETACNGEEALEAALRERPALILSDVMMPRLDGFGLLAAVRGDRRLRTLPMVLLSARAGEEATVEGLTRGADDYLVKPFTARELLARVAAIIELDRVRRATEEQVRVFLAGAKMFTWDIDLATGEVNVSQNAEDVLGAPPRNVKDGLAAIHPDDQARHRAAIEKATQTCGELWDEVRILRTDNGETRWLEIRAHVVCERGQAIKLSGISFDITERKQLEAQLRDGDRRKDEFLAMLAHELRNPMAPIRNAGELMLRLSSDDQRVRKAAEIINRQVGQLTRMVDDLMDVSRITRGRVELERKPVELSSVVAAAIEAVEPAVRERRHTLTVSSGLPLTVVGDAARLQQCVVNLLMNAVKYTDPGGHIRVELARQGNMALVQVSDSGVGMAPEILPNVFDLFVQSDRTLDRSRGGLGIGLSIVKRLIEMHGGQVQAHSPGVGGGSVFEMKLPLAEAVMQHESSRALSGGERKRVVVVDDNRDAAETLSQVLELDGHDVQVVFNAEDALRLIPARLPDVVFLDIGLPEISGYDLARQLRDMPALRATRLVALTGYGQPTDRQLALRHGFDAHLVKPASMHDVIAALNSPASKAH
jgi:PAS domain S-box-containing protein